MSVTPKQAMSVYSEQYWSSLSRTMETMTPEQIEKRFGKKMLDKMERNKLESLKRKTDPANKSPQTTIKSERKSGHISERDYDRAFQERIAGL